MFKKKEPEKVSLDELLNNSEQYRNSRVEIDNLIIDKLVPPYLPLAPALILVHDERGSKQGIIAAECFNARIITALSESGHKINVKGTFYIQEGITYIGADNITNLSLNI